MPSMKMILSVDLSDKSSYFFHLSLDSSTSEASVSREGSHLFLGSNSFAVDGPYPSSVNETA